MKKISFAIIGPFTENSNDLKVSAEKAGAQALVFELTDIVFKTENGQLEAYYRKKNLLDFDVVIFRGYNLHIYEAKMLAKMLLDNKKTVIEQSLGGFYTRGKMQQAAKFAEKDIPHPQTCQALSQKDWEKLLGKMKFPIIAKPNMGRKGRDIIKFEKLKDAVEFFNKNKNDFLAQKYYPIKSDYRVFVVGGKAIGGFQRFIFDGEYKSNVHGTPAEKIMLSSEMRDLAVKATKAVGYEVAGVDLMEYKNKLYIIEVNVAPQWEKFKNITGINPAEYIIKYALKKHLGK